LGFRYDDGLAGPPRSRRHVSECYPSTTIVGAEELGYAERPLYKRGPQELRQAVCDELIRRVDALREADPPLDLRSHPVTRELVEEPSPGGAAYKHREDLLDAAIAAWTASLWFRHGLRRCQVLGDASERPAATIIAPVRLSAGPNG